MALVASTDGYSQGIGFVEMRGSFSGANTNPGPDHKGWFDWGYGSFGFQTSKTKFPGDTGSGNFSNSPNVNKDTIVKFRAKASDEDGEAQGSSSGNFKTYADTAVFPTALIPGTPTSVSCPVTGTVKPKTVESEGDVVIEYREKDTEPWFETGQIASNLSGSGTHNLSGTIYGLTPGTIYEARFRIDRDTENDTIAYSDIGTFTTVTEAATIIGGVVMEVTYEMLVPANLQGVVIDAVLPEDLVLSMSTPLIITTNLSRIVGRVVIFNDKVEVKSCIAE